MSWLDFSRPSPLDGHYDVFLSFQGDTRYGFTANLYQALKQNQIHTFMDCELQGEDIHHIFEVIAQSRMAVVIYSEKFASSDWCLKELDTILARQKEKKILVTPILYEVDVKELRHLTGKTEAYLDQQIAPHGKTTVDLWKGSVRKLVGSGGISYKKIEDRSEYEFIEHVIATIKKKLLTARHPTQERSIKSSQVKKQLPSSDPLAANETSSLNQVNKEEPDEESSQGSSDNKTATGKATLENRPKTTLFEAMLLNSVKPLARDSTPNNIIRTTNNGWSFGAEIIAWLGVIHRLLTLIGTYLHWTPGGVIKQTQRHCITFPSGESSVGATDTIVRSNVTSTNEVANHPNQASYEYDVFLSFRGEDTRESFTSTLCYALCVHKVKTFMDVIFRKGNKLEELLKMVEKSRMSIVVFSENFAESEWCLKELAKIFEESDRRGHEVLPVFYKVNPSELRHQNTGKTKKHMDKHINTYGKDSDKFKTWSNAIKELGNSSGYTYWSGRGKLEVELAQEIAQEILTRLHGREASEQGSSLITSSSKLSDIISTVTKD